MLVPVTAPTTYDANSYAGEILAFSDSILSLNIGEIIQSYGALVTFIYSPAVLFDIHLWCAFVNVFLMTASVRMLSCSSAAIFSDYIRFSAVRSIIPLRHQYLTFKICLLFLTSFNPYYIASYLVPSKDIASLFVFSVAGSFVLQGRIRSLGLSAILLAISFFTRISVFFAVLFSVIQFRLLSLRTTSRFYNAFCPFVFYVLAFILVSLFNPRLTNEYVTAGSFITDITNSALKPLLFPFFPFLYSLWDLSKPFLSSDSEFNAVVFAFAFNSVYIALLLPVFFFVFGLKKSCYWPSRRIKQLTIILFVALSVVFCNSFVHPRYMYEFLPLIFILVYADACFVRNLRVAPLFLVAILVSFCLKVILLVAGLSSSNFPDYVLPTFLGLV